MNIELYFNKTVEDLDKLTTRHLLAILKNSRYQVVCWCCYSDCLHFSDLMRNENATILNNLVKEILSSREHVIRDSRQCHPKEKKQMRWSRK